jgi:tetratricopeptide (TPR) repeat protein
MKEFFKRLGAELSVEDFARYVRILIDDLGPILKCEDFKVHLLNRPEQVEGLEKGYGQSLAENKVFYDLEQRELILPVVYENRPLAVLSLSLPPEIEFPQATHPFLLSIISQSLEKILLYKINITDQDTGLYNEDYLRAFLRKELKDVISAGTDRTHPKALSLDRHETYPGLTLLVIEIVDFHELTLSRGRLEAAGAVKLVARKMAETFPSSNCLGRISSGRLAVVLPQKDIKTGMDLAGSLRSSLKSGDENYFSVNLAVGLATYPQDFIDDISKTDTPDVEGDLAESLVTKAELALNQALADENNRLFTFGEILKNGGRIVQILPLERVVVNLGRNVGAAPGQVFGLSRVEGEGGEVDFKGEVVLFKVEENFSVGEVINLRNSLSRVKAGDVLTLSQERREDPSEIHQKGYEQKDTLLGIPDRSSFMAALDDRMADEEKFALFLMRVDGYDRYRETRGRLASDQQLKGLCELLEEDIPEKAFLGRYSADCLVVLCPGIDEIESWTLAQAWQEKVTGRHSQTVSIGLAAFPCHSFNKLDILANAQRALDHASFFGANSSVAFDAVSLNISADRLFDAGDLDGAIGEFQKALELNPNDLNVLNSLGVCYGHQQLTDEALKCYNQVLELDPENLMACYNQGFMLVMADRQPEALDNFRRAVEIDPGNFDALFQFGKTALDLEMVDEAITHLQSAVKAENMRPIVYRYLAEGLIRAGRDEEAIGSLKAAVRVDPKDSLSMSQLGALYLDRGTDSDVALSLTRQSVDLDPANSIFRERLARARAEVGDLAGAEADYIKALEMGIEGREIYFRLGQIIKEQNRPEEAREWFERAVESDVEYQPAIQALAEMEESEPMDKEGVQEETRM